MQVIIILMIFMMEENNMLYTEKVYYSDMFLTECEATVLDIIDNKIILDKTVAYPEGGGQISDCGHLCFDGNEIPFYEVKKGLGRSLHIDNFPSVNVDTVVYHFVDENDIALFNENNQVKVKIDVNRRLQTTIHHSALHLALMFACDLRPDLMKQIRGCNITTNYGRLDFYLTERFTADDLNYINKYMNEAIHLAIPIESYHHPDEKEAWYWKCKEFICPCGGTHVFNTQQLGNVIVKRKNIGKNMERLIVVSDCKGLSKEIYHA